jgi:IS30 family transposase
MRGEQIAACERARQALDLRRTGVSYRDIAQALGVAPSTAFGYVRAELDALRKEAAESASELREIELHRLDALTAKLFAQLDAATAREVSALALAILRLSESRRQLLGLDAPQKVELGGNIYTVRDVSPDCAEWGAPTKQEGRDAAA